MHSATFARQYEPSKDTDSKPVSRPEVIAGSFSKPYLEEPCREQTKWQSSDESGMTSTSSSAEAAFSTMMSFLLPSRLRGPAAALPPCCARAAASFSVR
jgi:hypothetical protein